MKQILKFTKLYKVGNGLKHRIKIFMGECMLIHGTEYDQQYHFLATVCKVINKQKLFLLVE